MPSLDYTATGRTRQSGSPAATGGSYANDANSNSGEIMKVEPYLFFDGRCEEAIEFYKKALGARVETLMRFKESPDPASRSPGNDEKILHSSLRISDMTVYASDGHGTGGPNFKGFALSLGVANEAEADRVFAALSPGGKVQMPLGKTFYSPRFGMVTDRFGVLWMVIVGK
jgi:PhnB protein